MLQEGAWMDEYYQQINCVWGVLFLALSVLSETIVRLERQQSCFD